MATRIPATRDVVVTKMEQRLKSDADTLLRTKFGANAERKQSRNWTSKHLNVFFWVQTPRGGSMDAMGTAYEHLQHPYLQKESTHIVLRGIPNGSCRPKKSTDMDDEFATVERKCVYSERGKMHATLTQQTENKPVALSFVCVAPFSSNCLLAN